jgi:hypothetical protein
MGHQLSIRQDTVGETRGNLLLEDSLYYNQPISNSWLLANDLGWIGHEAL